MDYDGQCHWFTTAFHAPLAAMAFVAEELNDNSLSRHHYHMLWAVLLASLILIGLNRDGLFFPTAMVPNITLAVIPLLILVAFGCGVVAALLLYSERTLRRHILDRFPFWLVAGFGGAIVGIIAVMVGSNTIGGGLDMMQNVLAGKIAVPSVQDVAGRFMNTVLNLLSGNAGGTLAPALFLVEA